MKPETLLYSLDEVGEDLLAASERPLQERKSRLPAWLAAAAALVFLAGLGYVGWRMLRAGRPVQSALSPSQTLPVLESGEPMQDNPPEQPSEAPTESDPAPEVITPGISDETVDGLPKLSAADSWQGTPNMADYYTTAEVRWPQRLSFSSLPVFATTKEVIASGSDMADFDRSMSETEQLALMERLLDALGIVHESPLTQNSPGMTCEIVSGALCFTFDSVPAQVIVVETGVVSIRYHDGYGPQLPAELESAVGNTLRQYYLEQYYNLLQIPGATADELGSMQQACFVADYLRRVDLRFQQGIYFDAAFQNHHRCLGQYPIISYDEAIELAQNGQCFYKSYQKPDYIAECDWSKLHGTELLYPKEIEHALKMPFYRFWVHVTLTPETPDANHVQRDFYMPVFVPAIRSEYLTDFPFESMEDGASS